MNTRKKNHTQIPAASNLTTPDQHLHNLRKLFNYTKYIIEDCEMDFKPLNIARLITAANNLSRAAKKTLTETNARKETTIKPPQTEIDQELENKISPDPVSALAGISADEAITLEASKIKALADVLITTNQSGQSLFEGTTETLLCSIINHAEAIDAAAKKIG